MKLIFIHGRAQEHKDPHKLQRAWEEAWGKGLRAAGLNRPRDVIVEFPYYGDALDKLVRQINAPLVADIRAKGAPPDDAEATFRADLLSEFARAAGITESEIQQHFHGEAKEKGPLNWEWVQSILKALDRTPLGSTAIDAFTRDVYVYLNYRAVQEVVDATVADHLKGDRCVVVGHSLGSVVGYNVLRSVAAAPVVPGYVTVGSPLGVMAVKNKLETPIKMPACVKFWFNAYDERDVVALNPLDQRHFDVTPPIQNKNDVNNGTSNRHGIGGYLDDPVVARKIHEALSG